MFCIDTFIQLVAVTAEWLVDSINGLTDSGHITKEFVGVILLPIVGNAAGSYTTCISLNPYLWWTIEAIGYVIPGLWLKRGSTVHSF